MTIFTRHLFTALQQALDDRRVVVITGMRRVGKTTTLKWLLEQIPSPNKIYLDLERLDNRAVFQESNYDVVLNFLRNRGLDVGQPVYVGLDEIQYAPNVPSVVKVLYDARGIKFILTGSSSYYLKNYFTESLAGRKVVFELFPLSFGEFLTFKSVPYRQRERFEDMRFDPYEYERLKAFYEEYLEYGGLPDVVLEPQPGKKVELLQDIFSSYINIDVRTMADFQKVTELRQLLKVLASRIGNKVDNTGLASVVGISRSTLLQYLEFLEKTYVLYRLPAYSTSPDRMAVLSKKLYFYDNGIAGILSKLSEGALFENAVFNQLRNYGNLAYLSRGNEYEIDFILTRPTPADEERLALEVKIHPVLRDDQHLKRIAAKYPFQNSYLIGKFPTPTFNGFIWGGLLF